MRNVVLALMLFLSTWYQDESLAAMQKVHDARPIYTIYTASPRGTYYKIAEDIRRACNNLNIQIENTDGSLDNINHLITPQILKTGHRFALAQNDVLTSLFGSDANVKQLVQIVLELYNEDINILVNRASKIESLKDLDGKRVAVGTITSGVWFTANAIKNQLGINWIAVETAPEESILSVLTGEIDAMILVAGHPVQMFSELSARMRDRVKLLSLKDAGLNRKYSTSRLPEWTYLWQPEIVELKSTKSVLVAAKDVPTDAINDLLSCVKSNEAALRRWGHPKWNEVKFPLSRFQKHNG